MRLNWYLLMGLSLVAASGLFYLVHFLIFRDPHHIFIYFLGDLAFLPIEVLLVSLIIHRLLSERERRAVMKKMNMVIGAFYSEVGTAMIKRLSAFDQSFGEIQKNMVFRRGTDQELAEARSFFDAYHDSIDSREGDLVELKDFLAARREFLLRLLENPNLLEHETFTDLLWAVFHLDEELEYRSDLHSLTLPDLRHISHDMSRAYGLLIADWIKYMKHLRDNYPYLFSLALRINPFDPGATPGLKSGQAGIPDNF